MREIKFRAWIIKLGKWAEEVRGDCWGYIAFYDKVPYYNCELEQYTGLKDRNGKEIYEGDICIVGHRSDIALGVQEWYDEHVYLVKWHGGEGYPAFDLEDCDWDMNGLAYVFQSGEMDIEIIGNIHEHPELLKKEGA